MNTNATTKEIKATSPTTSFTLLRSVTVYYIAFDGMASIIILASSKLAGEQILPKTGIVL